MHQAHSPGAPPTGYTVHTTNQRPNGAQAITPAPPTEPGPKWGGRQGSERRDNNWRNQNHTTPHHNVPITAHGPQTKPQAPPHASVP